MTVNFNLNGMRAAAPIQPVSTPGRSETTYPSVSNEKASFKQVFEKELRRSEGIQFSHHASQRMSERGMNLTPDLMSKMNNAVNQAAAKGSKQSLVLIQNAAYIVNVPSRTVITALNDPFKQGHVFTAIDSTICIE